MRQISDLPSPPLADGGQIEICPTGQHDAGFIWKR
jgi:hypothetical protein